MGNQASSNLKAPLPSYNTGIDVEEKSFTWTISNFPLIRKSKSLIESQKLDFTVGETSTGQPVQWTAQLLERTGWTDGKRWIGINIRAKKQKDNEKYLDGDIKMAIKSKNGAIRDSDFGQTQGTTKLAGFLSFGLEKLIDADDGNSCPGETLGILFSFKLYFASEQKSTTSLEAIMNRFKVTFLDQIRKDFSKLLTPAPGSDIKVVSSDKKEFSMQRAILAARSGVFAAMLSSDMIEANSGVIKLPDISSKALQVFLHFLNTGDLLPEWSDPEVIKELTNAAAKYHLQDLLHFLDQTLGKVCKLENAIPLLFLAQQLPLKVAEEELWEFVKKEAVGSVEKLIQMCSLDELPGTDEESEEPRAKKARLN